MTFYEQDSGKPFLSENISKNAQAIQKMAQNVFIM